MAKNFSRWLPVVVWMAVIFIFSNQPDLPGSQIDWLDFFLKKSAHVSEYFILLLLAHKAFGRPLPDYALLLSFAYAFTDETHQVFVPGRGANLTDILFFDFFGICLACLFLIYIKKRRA